MRNLVAYTILSSLLFSCGVLEGHQMNKKFITSTNLTDQNTQTVYEGVAGDNNLFFDGFTKPMRSYKLFSSGEMPEFDPASWVLKGSKDGKNWVILDTRRDQKFCSRFQEILCEIQNPGNYTQYLLEVRAANNKKLKLADVSFFEKDLLEGWRDFKYPKVNFEIASPQTEGAKIYAKLVQNPDEYVKYHTQKVAEILFFKADDPMNDVQQINYTLRDYDGISAKGGQPPVITIEYSTQWVEKSAKESLHKLDYETRGVLYHELTHAYQNEPKGIGNYSNNKVFWAMIEGEADAVRAQAGLFDFKTQRKVGGNWMDGYKTTGFFIQWLTTKDPDAIRKFNKSAAELPVWSFDGAMKYIFGQEASIENLWEEYQKYLKSIK